MKYTITVHGYGGELHIGTVDKQVWDYFSASGNLGAYLRGEEEVPAEISDKLPKDNLFELDNVLHMFGPFFEDGTYLNVHDEDGVEVYEGVFDETFGEDVNEVRGVFLEPFEIMNSEHDYLFSGLDIQRGIYGTYTIEDEKFDPEKLRVDFKLISDGTNDIYMVTDLFYGNVKLEMVREHETRGKSAYYRLYDVKSNDFITSDDEDDFSD